MLIRRGQDKRGFHKRVTFHHIVSYVDLSVHVLHAARQCQWQHHRQHRRQHSSSPKSASHVRREPLAAPPAAPPATPPAAPPAAPPAVRPKNPAKIMPAKIC